MPLFTIRTCGFTNANPLDSKFGHEKSLASLEPVIRGWLSRPQSEVLAFYGDQNQIVIKVQDLTSLLHRTTIAHSLMAFVFEYLQNLCHAHGYGTAISMMHTMDTAAFHRCEMIFLPLHRKNHWSLLVVLPHLHRCLAYDPLPTANYDISKTICDEIGMILGQKLQLVIIGTPQQIHRGDSGMLTCEITAYLVRRLLDHERSLDAPITLSMGLSGLSFSVKAGRGYLLTLVAAVSQSRSSLIPRSGIRSGIRTRNMATAITPDSWRAR